MAASNDVYTPEGSVQPSNIGLTSSVLPEAKSPVLGVSSDTGVSTRNAHTSERETHDLNHWYALRTTYGRERKAYDYIVQHKGIAFLPTIIEEKIIKGEKEKVEVSRIPNILFVYGTEENVKLFVYDNVNLPYLRFYYKHTHTGARIEKSPLVVPNNQIKSLQIICESETGKDTLILNEEVEKFQKGEKVIVKEGSFAGVSGIVARYHGQQRVGLVIDGLLTAITTYIPTAFLERIV